MLMTLIRNVCKAQRRYFHQLECLGKRVTGIQQQWLKQLRHEYQIFKSKGWRLWSVGHFGPAVSFCMSLELRVVFNR